MFIRPFQHALDAGGAADRSEQPVIAAGEDQPVNVSGLDAVVEHPR